MGKRQSFCKELKKLSTIKGEIIHIRNFQIFIGEDTFYPPVARS
jgi:hypothetical protein